MPSKIRKRGKRSYQLSVPNGKQPPFTKTVKCDTKAEAERQFKLFEAECLQGLVIPSGKAKITLSQLYAYWLTHHGEPNLAKKTLSYYQYLSERTLAALGHLKLENISSRHIHQFLDQLRKPDITSKGKALSQNTIRKHFSFLKDLLTYAVKWDFLVANPLSKMDTPKKVRSPKVLPSASDLSALLTCLMKEARESAKLPKKYLQYLRYRLWVLLSFSLGLRREEIFGLQIQDINFKDNLLSIERAVVFVAGEGTIVKETKTTSSNRTLAMPQKIHEILHEYIGLLDKPEVPLLRRWLFSQPNGKVTLPDTFNAFLTKFTAKHGLAKFSPHLLRHMYGSYLMQSGVDLATTSHQLGHSNKSFTADTYIHVTEQVDRKSAETMDGILSNLTNNDEKKIAS
jgi:Site-specific recombinase XerD